MNSEDFRVILTFWTASGAAALRKKPVKAFKIAEKTRSRPKSFWNWLALLAEFSFSRHFL